MAAGAGTDGSEEWVAGDGTTDRGTMWSGGQRRHWGRIGGSYKRTEKQEQEKKQKCCCSQLWTKELQTRFDFMFLMKVSFLLPSYIVLAPIMIHGRADARA